MDIDTGREHFLSFRVSPRVYNELELKRVDVFSKTGVNVSIAQVAKGVLAKALGIEEEPAPAPARSVRKGLLRRKKERS